MGDFDRTIRALRQMAGDAGTLDVADALGSAWVETARQVVPVDTGQLKARTNVTSVTGGRSLAEATVQADTPYAGFVEYGTRYMAPRPFFRTGRDAAEALARELGGRYETAIERALTSGGVWNPRNLIP